MPEPRFPPRVLVADTGERCIVYVRNDVSDDVRAQLAHLPPQACASDEDAVCSILGRDWPCEEVWRNQAYIFAEEVQPGAYAEVVQLDEPNDIGCPVFAILVNGVLAAACSSSRENSKSGEAWVFTNEAYRGRGYSARVTSAWTHDLQQHEKIPFYSHLVGNTASRAVARKLDLTPFAHGTGYS